MTTTAADTLEERLRAALAPNLLLVREIGAGGMARVFLAREPALKRLVAVKVLSGELASTQAGRARFEREAQAVAGLSHPNIVAVHSVGELSDGTPYFIMQYVDGRSMAERVEREGPLSVAEARRTLGEVAAALAAAHKQGIIHRDVKPANILYEDASGRSLVSDFGIAAIGRETPTINTKLTATGAIVGTPQYMSPEQLLAEPVTEKTDVYSLGLLAHELLCGSAPFKGSSPHELIAAHLRDVPARLAARRTDVDPELDAVVARCLEKSAAERPTAEEVWRRLSPGAGALLEWPPPGLEELHGRLRRLSSMFMLGGGSVAALLVATVVGGPSLDSALTSAVTLSALIAIVAGIIALFIAIGQSIRTMRRVRHAIRGGYAWLTVLETMADARGDTGNVIVASREYADLSAEQRDRLRRRRIRRELALLAGGALALPFFILIVALGSSGLGGWQLALLGLLPPFGGLIVFARLAQSEHREFAARRAKRRTTATDVARLSAPWYEAFEAVRRGQTLHRGTPGRENVLRWSAVAAATALVGTVLVATPLIFYATIGPAHWSIAAPKFINTLTKFRIANVVRSYRVPADSTISPMEAGTAFSTLQGPPPRPSAEFPVRAVVDLPPPAWRTPLEPSVFRNARHTQVNDMPSSAVLVAALRGNVSQAERAHLERIARMPHWRYWDVLGRARSMDYLGARFELPFSRNASAYSLPIPRFAATKEFAYASPARAAYYLAQGKRDSAEAVLRSTISVGFLFLDEGNTAIEGLIGAVLVGIGRAGLIDYYKAIGDPRAVRIQAEVDSVIAQADAATAVAAAAASVADDGPFANVDMRDVAAVRAAAARQANDRRMPRGIRLEMLFFLSVAPCTNLRELVFGPAPDVERAFAVQKTALARFPSDAALVDLIYGQSAANPPRDIPRNRIGRAAGALGRVVNNRRLAWCTAWSDVFAAAQ